MTSVLSDDLKRAQVLIGELSGWSGAGNVFGFYVYLVSDAKRRCRETISVCSELISVLRDLDLISEHRVQFVEVYCIAAGLNRGDIAFRMH